MPHNRFYLPISLTAKAEVVLEGKENSHLTRVMRAKVGEEVELVNGKGDLATAAIKEIGKEQTLLVVKKTQSQGKQPGLIIVQGFPKSSKLDLIVEKGVELGMEELWLFPAARSEKILIKEHQRKRLEEIAVQAMKQCGRLYLPKIKVFSSLPPVEKTAFYGTLESDAPSFLHSLFEKGDELSPLFFIGPESGFTKEEIDQLKRAGAFGVSLHSNTLRTETASFAALAVFSALRQKNLSKLV